MQNSLDTKIADALGPPVSPPVAVDLKNPAELRSCFAVSDLATASFRAAAVELGGMMEAGQVAIDCRLASMWFDSTLRPKGWETPSAWDPIAGAYRTSDGWIRLHTNAPHHRDAALRVIGSRPETQNVARAVAEWSKAQLEEAIVAGGGAAAAMHTMVEWRAHAQGRSVAEEPLIEWNESGTHNAPVELEQVKVLDLTRVLAGPVATRFLAGFGADVLRIDPPWWNEPGVEPEVTLGKTLAGLDLNQADDRKVFETLLGQADVFVHGYRPGALRGLGYGEDELRRIAPQLIGVSLCAYGWSGPWSGRRGFDSLVQMSCGIADEGMRRQGAQSPVPLPVQALDHATGYLMAAAVLRALGQRNATGRVLSARLSLARTAALLMSEKPHDFKGENPSESPTDLDTETEMTSWGPARRLTFPVKVDGVGPKWRRPARALRTDLPRWAFESQA